MFDNLDSTEPFTTDCNGSNLVDFMIDIDLLDSSAAWTACAEFTAVAYGRLTAIDSDGLPFQVALTN